MRRAGRRTVPRYVRELIDWGAPFDREPDGDAGARDRRGAQRAPRAARPRRHRPRDRPRALAARVVAARRHGARARARRRSDRRGRALRRRLLHRRRMASCARPAPAPCCWRRAAPARSIARRPTRAVATGDGVAMALPRRRGGGGPRVRPVPSDRAEGRGAAAVPAVGGAARRRGAAGQRATASAFVARYEAAGDLASRDRVSRAIAREEQRTGRPVYLSLQQISIRPTCTRGSR